MTPFVPADNASVAAFIAVLVFVVAALLWAVQRAYGSVRVTLAAAAGLAAWLGGFSALVAAGCTANVPLPVFFVPIVVIWTGVGLSPVGRNIAATVPLGALVAFQGFRLPLEIVLHMWAEQGTIPTAMSWSGRNVDVISGVTALLCAVPAARDVRAAWLANIVGAVLLLNVMRVALLSTLPAWARPGEPLLQLAAHLPYALIGPVCVGGALFGHVVLTRALLLRR